LIAIAFFVLSLSVVGFILVGIIGFIDGLLSLLCLAGVGGSCFTLVGTLLNTIVRGFYSGDTTIDFNHKDDNGEADLVKIDSFEQTLAHPELGYQAGNFVNFSAHVTTHIFQKVPDDGPVWDYM